MITIAIFSHSENAYSETFIQAHRNLPFDVKYYYGDFLPCYLDGKSLDQNKWVNTLQRRKLSFFHHKKSSITDGELALISSLKKNKVSVVLAEYGVTGTAVLNVCKELSLPLLVHFHGWDASVKNILKQYGQQYQDMFSYANFIFSVSHSMTAKLVEAGCPIQKIVYNPYGPDDRFFDIQPAYTSQHFLAIGRFVDKKAPYFTILAFNRVLQQYPDATLTMAGDGPLWNTCTNLVAYLKIGHRVLLPGAISTQQWVSYLSGGIAFVQHSITAENGDMEGTPVAILEAQAAGLPVISTLHAGIPDVVIHNETGLLVAEQDVEGMATNMLKVLAEKGLAHQLGTTGKKRTLENFNMKRHLDTIQQSIEKVL